MLELVVATFVIGFVALIVIGHIDLFRALFTRRPD